MKYVDIKDKVKTGDLVAVMGRRSLLSKLTRLVTKTPYTHVGLIIWLDNAVWMAEINSGGDHLIPMYQIKEPFQIFRPKNLDTFAIEDIILNDLRKKTYYGYYALLRIGIYKLFGFILPAQKQYKTCNEYVEDIYTEAGLQLFMPKVSIPADLVDRMDFLVIGDAQ